MPTSDVDVDVGSDTDAAPRDAFAALGNEVRLRTLVALLEAAPRSFTDLAAASGADSTAGFAYHLRQLRDRYVRKVGDEDRDGDADDSEDGYALTDAGARVARALRAGTYIASVDRDPVPVDDPCPLCGAGALVAAARDNTVAVSCGDCGRAILRLPLPPGGFRTHDDGDLPGAPSRQYRHRVALMADGGCPECGGTVRTRIEAAGGRIVPDDATTRRWTKPTATRRRTGTGTATGAAPPSVRSHDWSARPVATNSGCR